MYLTSILILVLFFCETGHRKDLENRCSLFNNQVFFTGFAALSLSFASSCKLGSLNFGFIVCLVH